MGTYAIIMGDIVKSREHQKAKQLSQLFNEKIFEANQVFKKGIVSPLTITLGDEFQGLVKSFKQAFQVAHQLSLQLLSHDIRCRFVVGQVDLVSPPNSKVAWNMMGEGLAEAREKLNEKEDPNFYKFSGFDRKFLILLDGMGRSMSEVEKKWTPTQIHYVSAVFDNIETPKAELAEQLGISRNTLYKTIRSAEFQYYLQQKYTIEETLSLYDQEIFKVRSAK